MVRKVTTCCTPQSPIRRQAAIFCNQYSWSSPPEYVLCSIACVSNHCDTKPLATLDPDIPLPTRFKVTGDEIYQRLASNGIFMPRF